MMNVFIGIITVMSILHFDQTAAACIDPCQKKSYCFAGDLSADVESNCTKYFVCSNAIWIHLPVSPGSLYDYLTCQSLSADKATCTSCSTKPPTPSGPCYDATSCSNGKKYADKGNCLQYYTCVGGSFGPATKCRFGLEGCKAGEPCTFDIESKRCVIPTANFSCEYRCPELPTVDAMVTTTQSISDSQASKNDIADATTSMMMQHSTDHTSSSLPRFKDATSTNHMPLSTLVGEKRDPLCIDPCKRRPYCLESETSADVNASCKAYFTCNFGSWLRIPLVGVLYDELKCGQVLEIIGAKCTSCPPPLTSGPCYGNTSTSCTDGERYADRANCSQYYTCSRGEYGDVKSCVPGTDDCIRYKPCAFNISSKTCVIPDANFTCEERCPTPTTYTTQLSTEDIVISTEQSTTQSPSTVISTEQSTTQSPFTVVSTEQSTTQSPSTVISTDQSTTQSPSTVISTEQSTTQTPSTVISTEQSTTQSPSTVISTEQSTTQSPSTVISTETSTTHSPSTVISTEHSTTQSPSTVSTVISTEQSTTQSPSTVISTEQSTTQSLSIVVSTEQSTTQSPSTVSTVISTEQSTTQSPSTVISTEQSTYQSPSTVISTEQSTTQSPSTVMSTEPSTTQSQSTVISTEQSTTQSPSTVYIVSTEQSTTQSPSTVISTEQSTTRSPSTVISTEQSTTQSPSTVIPTEQSTTQPSSTVISATQSTTQFPSTVISTEQSTTQSPSTVVSTEQSTTQPPSTVFSTEQSTTQPPSTVISTEQSTTLPPSAVIVTEQSTTQPPSAVISTEQSTTQPSSIVISTEQSSTQSPSTVVSTEQSTTQSPSTAISTEQSTTQSPSTVISKAQSTTQSPSTVVSTEQSTTQSPSTVVSTEQSTTKSQSTVISTEQSTTQPPSTFISTEKNQILTAQSTTVNPTTIVSTTQSTTVNPTTIVSTTQLTTVNPTTIGSTTQSTTVNPTTIGATTQSTTVNPTTIGSTTQPTTENPTTIGSTTQSTTVNPTTIGSTTQSTTVNPTTIGLSTPSTTVNPTIIGSTTQSTTVNPTTISSTTQSTTVNQTNIGSTTQSTTANPTTISSMTHWTTVNPDLTSTASQEWGVWGTWSSCSVTCGGGNRNRTRVCINKVLSENSCSGESSQTQLCGSVACPLTQTEMVYGYVIDIFGISRTEVIQLFGAIQRILAQRTNNYCNNNISRVKECCQITTNYRPDPANTLSIVEPQDVLLGILTHDLESVTLIIVIPIKPGSALCTAATATGRKKRGIMLSSTEIVLQQKILEIIIQDLFTRNSLETEIEISYKSLFNTTVNVTIGNYSLPTQSPYVTQTTTVELITTESANVTTTPTLSDMETIAIISSVAGGMIVLVIILLIVCLWRQNMQYRLWNKKIKDLQWEPEAESSMYHYHKDRQTYNPYSFFRRNEGSMWSGYLTPSEKGRLWTQKKKRAHTDVYSHYNQ